MSSMPSRDTYPSSFPAPAEEIVWVGLDDLKLGMFVHPLSEAKFLLRRQSDLASIKESGVRGMFVDLARSHLSASSINKASTKAKLTMVEPAAHRAAGESSLGFPAKAPASRARQFQDALHTLNIIKAPVENLLNDVRLGRAVANEAVVSIVEKITSSVEMNASAIISLSRIRSKDTFTYAHSVAVCALMANLARRLDLDASSQHELAVGGLLHDVGKMLVPSEVLNKPEKLTPGEMDIMRSHVLQGHDLLQRTQNVPAVALDICLHHHEKVDGTGYPERLFGDAISLPARMAAVCDVYDAITSHRPYKEAWTPSECLKAMFSWEGHFDPKILATFIKSVGIYPVGSLVRMESGNLAVVLDQNDSDLTKPTVRLFYCITRRQRIPFRDEVLDHERDAIVSRENPMRWGFMNWDEQWPRMLSA